MDEEAPFFLVIEAWLLDVVFVEEHGGEGRAFSILVEGGSFPVPAEEAIFTLLEKDEEAAFFLVVEG